MLKKRFAILSVLLALLCVFTFAFAACDNGSEGGVAEPGDPFEDYVEIPAEDTGSAPAQVTIATPSVSVAYKGTVQVTATVVNPVEGTLTWSVAQPAEGEAAVSVAEGGTAQILASEAQATVTLKGEAVTAEPVAVTATFVAADDAENTANAACNVTVGTRTVTVKAESSAKELYLDGAEAEKSATLTAVFAGFDAAETPSVAWSVTAGGSLVSLSSSSGSEVTITAAGDQIGTATIAATVHYNNGSTEQTAVGTVNVSVTKHILNQLAFIDFENAEGQTLQVESGYGAGAVTAKLDQAAGLSMEHVKNGTHAFKVTGDADKDDEDEHFTVDFSKVTDVVVQATDTLSFSFWYYQTGQGIGDWSAMVSVNGFDGYRATFLNMWAGAGAYPDKGGVLEPGYNATSLTAGANDQQWHHIVLEMNATDGVLFYLDGDLVCTYPRATVSDAKNLFDVFQYWMALPADGNNINANFVFFGDIEGGAVGSDLYVDDVRITKNISAADLYAAANAQ